MVVNHDFNITHDLSIAAVSFLSHESDAGAIAKDTSGLRVEDKRNGQEAFNPFCYTKLVESREPVAVD